MPVEATEYDESLQAMKTAKDEVDPFCLYVVVRESLSLSHGKLAVQCMHGMQFIMLRYMKLLSNKTQADSDDLVRIFRFEQWFRYPYRKVLLGADEKEWEKLKSQEQVFLVKDAGLNEVESGTETVIVLWPSRKSEISKLVRRLQSYKVTPG